MSGVENKAAARRMFEEVWSQGRFEALDELVAPEFQVHVAGRPEPIRGPKAFEQFVRSFREGLPDLTLSVEDQVAEGDRVVTRWSGRGTHEGDLMGIPATGKELTFDGIVIARLANGTIKESWGVFDALGMLQQVGVAPAVGARA